MRLRSMRRGFAAGLVGVLLASCSGSKAPGPVHYFEEGMPKTLAEWNVLYVADGHLRLNQQVLPYDLATPLFTDYAHKLRTVWMPAGTSAGYEAQDSFDFPVGTIISKTFYYPRGDGDTVLGNSDAGPDLGDGGLALDKVRLVETRLLVHRKDGWAALPYVWNAAQTEAVLMRSGELIQLTLVKADGHRDAFDYAVPDQNQCAGCHGTDLKQHSVFPIGPKARHLDRDFAYTSGIENQLTHWQEVGYLTGVPNEALPKDAVWNDPKAPLDARARAYLDINCGHCHSPTGAGKTSGLWLYAANTDPMRLGRCKLPIAAGTGTGGHAYDIVPGDPDASILLYRMQSTNPGEMMPELGRGLAHVEGVALIRAWIQAMERDECG